MSKLVNVPFALGRKDSVEPKYAPYGALAVCKNLRVRKDGRLVSRYGYQPLSQGARYTSTLKAFDIIEFADNLVALSGDSTVDFPMQVNQYTGIGASSIYWNSETNAFELTPFVDFKEVFSSAAISGTISASDSAAGGGYCLNVVKADTKVIATIVKESNSQVIYSEIISTTLSTSEFRCTFAVDTFYIASTRSDNSIDILQFTVGTSTAFSSLVTAAFSASGATAVVDIVPVDNPTTGRIAIARDKSTTTTTAIRIYASNATQIGSDITIASLNTVSLSITADQTANKIHVDTVEDGGSHTLRSYNFSGTLLVGPTTLQSALTTSIVRIPAASAGGSTAKIACVSTDSNSNTYIQWRNESDHSSHFTKIIYNFVSTSRVISWQKDTQTFSGELYSIVLGGYVAPNALNDDFATNALVFASPTSAHLATRDYTNALPGSRRNIGLHLDSSTNKVTWSSLRDPGTESPQGTITTFTKHYNGRRQSVTFGNLLYLASNPVQVFDGRFLFEYFQELPGIVSIVASNGAGTLTNSATYSYVVHWEITLSDGSFWASAVSNPLDVTMGASDDTNTVVVSTPHHSAIPLGVLGYSSEITVVLSRTEWDAVGNAPGSIYRKCATSTVSPSSTEWGKTVSIVDTMPDSTLASQEIVYNQSARGVNGGTLEHNAPRAAKFLGVTESRLCAGGSNLRSEIQVSKEAFIGEPFTFSEFSAFFAQVAGEVVGIHGFGSSLLIFTKKRIYALSGPFPTDEGANATGSPVDLQAFYGLKDWRSIISDSSGTFFQLDNNKLFKLLGGTATWDGVDVQDTLNSYPVVKGACKVKRDDAIVFACNNAETSTDARLIVRDIRTGVWSEDAPPLQFGKGIDSVTSFGDSMAYSSGGVVYVQSTSSYADETSTVITLEWKTHPIYPMGIGGYCSVNDVMITGEYRSAGTLALTVEDAKGNSTAYHSFSISGLTVGQLVQKRWAIQNTETTFVVLRFVWTPSSAGEGLIINEAMIQATPREGKMNLLAPGDCA